MDERKKKNKDRERMRDIERYIERDGEMQIWRECEKCIILLYPAKGRY